MNDAPLPTSTSENNNLTAETFEDFGEALDVLYLKGNLSGRLHFAKAWPDAANHIFGSELIDYDHNGTTDIERRNTLEEQAETRRLEFLEIVKTLEEKSVEKSVLQIEYVEDLVKTIGRKLALLLYSPKIVNRFLGEESITEQVMDAAVTQTEKSLQDDAMNSTNKDIESLAEDIVPETPSQGAPSQSNPIVDTPEPKTPSQPASPEQSVQSELPDPFANPEQKTNPTPAQHMSPEAEEALDSIQPISLDTPAQQEPTPAPATPQTPSPKEPTRPSTPDGLAPPSPEQGTQENTFLGRSPYDRDPTPTPPPQNNTPADPTQQDLHRDSVHKALDGAPVASQKMTFMPAKKPDTDTDTKSQKPSSIPVIGGSNEKPKE